MKIVYLKEKYDYTKKYTCSICGKKFNWNDECYWFGQWDKEPDAYFCSDNCKQRF